MFLCFFASDLHGKTDRYYKLYERIKTEKPAAVFLGGDLLPSGLHVFTSRAKEPERFMDFFVENLRKLKSEMGNDYPKIFTILGNDDGKAEEAEFIQADTDGLLIYVHNRKIHFHDFTIYGYAYIPPTPFILKDWERYDVSQFVDPGCIAPEDGSYSVPTNVKLNKYKTIQKDLEKLTDKEDLSRSVFLFHSPPYDTALDRASLDGKMVDYVPLDVHVGSIAIKRFIKERQPYLTLHGHVHESTSLTGKWKIQTGRTISMNAAHNGPELSLIRFHLDNPGKAERLLI